MLLPTDSLDKFDAKKPPRPRNLTAEFEGSAEEFVWMPDSERLYFGADDRGKRWYYSTSIKPGAPAPRLTFISHNANYSLSVSRDGERMAFARAALNHPSEVMVADAQFKLTNVSQANTKVLAELDLPRPESVNVLGAGGTPMQMWILKPPGFDAKKKWPLVYLVHGGPQGAWEDSWSFRWNPQA